jgi:hypothetical protein
MTHVSVSVRLLPFHLMLTSAGLLCLLLLLLPRCLSPDPKL